MEAAEADRRGDHEPPARPGAFALDRLLGLLDIRQDTPGALEIARTGIGQSHLACGPLQQPRAETLLQRGDQPRHG